MGRSYGTTYYVCCSGCRMHQRQPRQGYCGLQQEEKRWRQVASSRQQIRPGERGEPWAFVCRDLSCPRPIRYSLVSHHNACNGSWGRQAWLMLDAMTVTLMAIGKLQDYLTSGREPRGLLGTATLLVSAGAAVRRRCRSRWPNPRVDDHHPHLLALLLGTASAQNLWQPGRSCGAGHGMGGEWASGSTSSAKRAGAASSKAISIIIRLAFGYILKAAALAALFLTLCRSGGRLALAVRLALPALDRSCREVEGRMLEGKEREPGRDDQSSQGARREYRAGARFWQPCSRLRYSTLTGAFPMSSWRRTLA